MPFTQLQSIIPTMDNQRNRLETQAKALMISAIRPGMLQFGAL